MDRLGEFYNKKAALVQGKDIPKGLGAPMAAPPPGFGEYKKAGGGGAMALIENIIADSAGVEKDAMAAEQDAQAAYESFIKDTNAEIKAKQTAIVADEENMGKDKIEEANDETDKRGTVQGKQPDGEVKKKQQRLEREAAEKQAKQDPNKGKQPDGEVKKK